MSGYLNINSIVDSTIIKSIAESSNYETKNNSIDTVNEWKSFLSGIVSAFCAGNITYETANKYINISSSIFEKDKQNASFKSGIMNGLDEFHSNYNNIVYRKIYAWTHDSSYDADIIVDAADYDAYKNH